MPRLRVARDHVVDFFLAFDFVNKCAFSLGRGDSSLLLPFRVVCIKVDSMHQVDVLTQPVDLASSTVDIDPAVESYVCRHNLAAVVDTIVQQVLEERPDDPFRFLADRLKLEGSLRTKGRSLAPSFAAQTKR